MKPSRLSFALLVGSVLGLSQGSCSDGFGSVRGHRRLAVELIDAQNVTGTRYAPIPLAIGTPRPFRIIVRALDENGQIDTNFNGHVLVSAKPGAVERFTGDDVEGRSLLLRNGESREVEVKVTNAYGTTFILADDLGYFPVDPLQDPPPQCSDGIDNDGDGRIDFPADEGCAFANDDSETGSSYAQGASVPIFNALPRVADVRGLRCLPGQNGAPPICSSSGETPFPKEQVAVNTGFHDREDGTQAFDFDLVVSRIASDGFYVADVNDTRGGFESVFAFNFNAPPRMRICDRMKTLGGTATEFFGFTQISYPTWTLEEWDPARRRCLVPEAKTLAPSDIQPAELLQLSGRLIRVGSVFDDRGNKIISVKVTPKLGPGDVPKVGNDYIPDIEATNCDFNKDGNVDFAVGAEEGKCSNACAADAECTEYSNFRSRGTFRLTVTDANKVSTAIQADSSASASFKAFEMRGKELKSFAGTLHYFSGGSQFTVEARCKDDIVVEADGVVFGTDKVCANDAECSAPFKCLPLINGTKACRVLDVNDLPRIAPPLACVSPRTELDINPQ